MYKYNLAVNLSIFTSVLMILSISIIHPVS